MRRSQTKLLHSPRYSLLLLTLAAGGGCAGRHRVEGMVLRVDPASKTMLVSHRAIQGVMPAMVMPFEAAHPRQLAGLMPGSRIEFDFQGGKARKIRVVNTRQAGDIEFPRVESELKAGEIVPDFTLTDQSNRPFSLSSARGRVVLVNFLYTRCPLAEACPRLAASFASLQRRFGARIPSDLLLVSITLDPGFDSPEVLTRYAAANKARPEGWKFLTGDTAPVAARFGLVYWAEEGAIIHNSQTAVIDREGRLVAIVEGSGYRLEQLADLVSSFTR